MQVDVKKDEDKLSFVTQALPPKGNKGKAPDSDPDFGPDGADGCEKELVE